MPQGFNFIAVVQNRIGSVIRFAITTSVACSVATVSNWIDYRSYWNGTIYSTQTVDFNILSHILPIFYSDRYLNSRGARTLADLLQGNWLISSSNVTIKVLENYNQQPAPLRKNELEQSLTKLTNAGIILQVKVQHSDCPHYFDHARLLEISMDDGKSYKLLFDQGMDFIEFNRSTQTYRVRVPTYVTLTNPGNGVFAINYRFIYSASQ